ncbi:MAG: sugar nucleotide-binding protein [Gammaproteobacteria bacterium]|nr:sugar nucleotide-binding protein [Gammaproteobacteria bacterium]
MTNIVFAGFGKLARSLASQFDSAEINLWGIARTPLSINGIKTIMGDLSLPLDDQLTATDRQQLDQIDYVIVTLSPDEISDDSYQKTYWQSAKNITHFFSKTSKKPIIIYISSTRVYAENDGEWVSEATQVTANNKKSESLIAAENEILAHNTKNIIVRFSGIYGGERQYLMKKVEAGIKVQKRPAQYTNRIHQEDCVGIICFLIKMLEQGESLDSIYIGTDDDPATLLDVTNHIAKEFGYPKPTVIINDDDLAPKGKRCKNDKIKSLGYNFKYPSYKNGYRNR